MKTLFTSLAILTLLTFNGASQVNPHAIGIRGGSGYHGEGAEISYQHGIGSANRLEADLGWRRYNRKNDHYSHMYLAVMYHWDWNIVDGLNWFVGPGGVIGTHNHKYHDQYDGLTLDIGGQIGIEYDFSSLGAPILIAIDVRPTWRFIGYYHNNDHYGYDGAFSIRYIF